LSDAFVYAFASLVHLLIVFPEVLMFFSVSHGCVGSQEGKIPAMDVAGGGVSVARRSFSDVDSQSVADQLGNQVHSPLQRSVLEAQGYTHVHTGPLAQSRTHKHTHTLTHSHALVRAHGNVRMNTHT
jgi:hypothetical protein